MEMSELLKEDSRNRRNLLKNVDSNGLLNLPIGHYIIVAKNNSEIEPAIKKLAIFGLGPCIALIFCDLIQNVSAMAHILLPCNRRSSPIEYPHKYANLSIKDLVAKMSEMGCQRENIKAVIIGGANIFDSSDFSVANENIRMVKKQLKLFNIKANLEITGGNRGRVLLYDPFQNKIQVKETGTTDFVTYTCRNGVKNHGKNK